MSYGIPYMGSKRKIAPKIMDYICAQNPKAKYFHDLFGGGGAMSFEALQRPQFERVTYNELNTGVVELLKKIRTEGMTDDFYQWVSREKFEAHKKDNDWFGGLVKTCWSFGNNQKSYLFGKDVEPIKKAAHEFLMANGYDKTTDSRVRLVKEFKAIEALNGRFELQQLQRLQQLERLQQLQQLEQLQRLQQLQQLQRLQQLQQLQRLDIQNHSYAGVVITTPIEETVIYLDPPYEKTAKYALSIDHRAFDEWVKNHPYKIYISSYESVFPCVFALNHQSSLGSSSNKKVVESLFCNKPENNFFNLF